jgi:hypothetical protein
VFTDHRTPLQSNYIVLRASAFGGAVNTSSDPYLNTANAPSLRTLQAHHHVHVTAQEWRWLIVLSVTLTLIAFLPLVWLAFAGDPDWQFMGMLHNYLDGGSYLSKMQLGMQGQLLVTFQHTPEPHNGALIQTLYPLMGYIAQLTNTQPLVIFHLSRAAASLFMYAAIYQLGATIWTRVETRRSFFLFAALGSGMGWLFAPLSGLTTFPDLVLPEAFPFYSTLMNVHFPLAIACLAILAAQFIVIFRPGAVDDPALNMGWMVTAGLSAALAFLYPQALVPFAGAVLIFVGIIYGRDRHIPARILRYPIALIAPAIPMALYILMVVGANPVMQEWNRQNVTAAPPPWVFAIGFAIPLTIGLPAIIRAARRFERDGDRFMLLWLVCIVICVYLPTNIQRRFAVAIMLPLAYFAARAWCDYWTPKIRARWRPIVRTMLHVTMAISPILVLFLPVLPLVSGNSQQALGVVIPRDYSMALSWIREHHSETGSVLAAPVIGAWIPGWAGMPVVYGHPYETLDASAKLAALQQWYAGSADCADLLEQFNVRYVFYGSLEAQLGSAPCLSSLEWVTQIGSVGIYTP